MKFTCKTINLREAVSRVERIVSKQTTLPVLSNILLSTEKGQLVVAATNLEIAIKVCVGAKIEEDGNTTIPARVLGGFLSTISDEVVTGELVNGELKINSENHKIKIKGIDAKDFPIIPDAPAHSFFTVDAQVFSTAVSGVLVSVAHNDTRQELNGVFARFSDNSITLASTDSFRLTEVVVGGLKIEAKDEFNAYREKNSSVILPALALSELQRITDDGDLHFVVDQNQLFMSTKTTKIISRLINGNYPEYSQVLPKKYDIEIKVNKKELVDALKISTLVSGGQSGEVKFSTGKSGKYLILKTESMDTGENISTISAQIQGPEFEVLFNSRYLLEGLNGILFDSEDVLLKLNKQKSPVLIKKDAADEAEKINHSYVIMPIIKG